MKMKLYKQYKSENTDGKGKDRQQEQQQNSYVCGLFCELAQKKPAYASYENRHNENNLKPNQTRWVKRNTHIQR